MPEPVQPVAFDEFNAMAHRLGIDADIREELYPTVRDLLLLTAMLNRLAPELSTDIVPDRLTVGVTTELR